MAKVSVLSEKMGTAVLLAMIGKQKKKPWRAESGWCVFVCACVCFLEGGYPREYNLILSFYSTHPGQASQDLEY